MIDCQTASRRSKLIFFGKPRGKGVFAKEDIAEVSFIQYSHLSCLILARRSTLCPQAPLPPFFFLPIQVLALTHETQDVILGEYLGELLPPPDEDAPIPDPNDVDPYEYEINALEGEELLAGCSKYTESNSIEKQEEEEEEEEKEVVRIANINTKRQSNLVTGLASSTTVAI